MQTLISWRRRQKVYLWNLFAGFRIQRPLQEFIDRPNELPIGWYSDLSNRSVFLYYPRDGTGPLPPFASGPCFEHVYSMWMENDAENTEFDDRFFTTAIPCSPLLGVDDLVKQHVYLCDLVLKRISGITEAEREQISEPWGRAAALLQTCRSVLLIADYGFNVRVVLTGASNVRDIGDISFDTWQDRMIEQPGTHIARMTIQNAFDFVRELEARESLHPEVEALHDRRREMQRRALDDAVYDAMPKAYRLMSHGSMPDDHELNHDEEEASTLRRSRVA